MQTENRILLNKFKLPIKYTTNAHWRTHLVPVELAIGIHHPRSMMNNELLIITTNTWQKRSFYKLKYSNSVERLRRGTSAKGENVVANISFVAHQIKKCTYIQFNNQTTHWVARERTKTEQSDIIFLLLENR